VKIQLAIPLLAGAVLFGQPPAPAWREFSIGPATKGQYAFSRNGIRAKGVTVRLALARAYFVEENRIVGPKWIADERYAITAIVDDPKDFQPLFQQELGNRFHLQVHREAKDLPVFVLKGQVGSGTPVKPDEPTGPRGLAGPASFRNGQIKMERATVGFFVNELGNVIGRPVFDETHMEGRFDFVLDWQAGNNASLQQAVKSQLGLELSDEQRGVEMLVIDHIEKLQFPK
jgi:uncharacterized protein (TIGR03435 family)